MTMPDINSHSPLDQLRAVRLIKNAIIGNKTKKEHFISSGIVPRLILFLATSTKEKASNQEEQDVLTQLKIQSAVVLGSLAYGSEQNVSSLISFNVIPPLLNCLSTCLSNSGYHSGYGYSVEDYKLLEAATRALKAIYQNPKAPKGDLLKEHHIRSLVSLLSPPPSFSTHPSNSSLPAASRLQIASLAASILARLCDTPTQQLAIANAGALDSLLSLLSSNVSKATEAALDCLAGLVRENAVLGSSLIGCTVKETGEKAVTLILKLVKDKSPGMRLLACSCLTNLHRASAIPDLLPEIKLTVIPTLVKLFSMSPMTSDVGGTDVFGVREKAPLVLAYLISDSEDLQKAAADSDAIVKLAEILKQLEAEEKEQNEGPNMNTGMTSYGSTSGGAYKTSLGVNDRLKESTLLALAAVSSLTESSRKSVIDSKILPIIVSSMSHQDTGVRAAACQCTRSLSRSVKNLRTSLVDAGVAGPLFQLLSDESISVQTTASATLCNIVLDFSPMKKTVLESGGVQKLVSLVSSPDTNLRLNSVWALKNLLFQAESEVKEEVMRTLGFDMLKRLINDPEPGIQEQALNLLRNLACGKESDIQAVFTGLTPAVLLQILTSKLSPPPTTQFSTSQNHHLEIILQTLYVIVNVATGNEDHKNWVVGSEEVLRRVLQFMSHERPNIRVATVWCIINLTWTEDQGSVTRIQKLRTFGFEDKLKTMVEDPDLDVRDRVKTALAHFNEI